LKAHTVIKGLTIRFRTKFSASKTEVLAGFGQNHTLIFTVFADVHLYFEHRSPLLSTHSALPDSWVVLEGACAVERHISRFRLKFIASTARVFASSLPLTVGKKGGF
jgi:hypothetical protein